MGIIWSNHAKLRLVERDLRKAEVVVILSNPVEQIKDKEKENVFKCYGILQKEVKEPKHLIIVYYQNMPNGNIKIITLIRTSKSGVKAYGFNI
ncbi:MAG: DUF4258 domain-containing protein [Candidatus Nitrosocosmicus sp.]|nr:DUF4258 domain-containing protein [Candidatus Nitrosocosmicus sp.]